MPTMPPRGIVNDRSLISIRPSKPLSRWLASTTTLPRRGPGGIWISSKSSLRVFSASDSHLLVARQAGLALGLAALRVLAHPVEFVAQSALELLVLLALDAEPFGLLLQVGRVVALVGVGPPAVELEDPLGDVVQEVPVVGDGEDRARVLGQVLLQPLHALGVEMVGRLVEQQQVGLLRAAACTARPGAARRRTGASTGSSPGGHRSASIACSIRLSSSQPLACSIFSISSPCSASSESKSASGSPIAAETSSNRASTPRSSATASSTFSRTVLVSSSGGSCCSRPTVAPGDSRASPLDAWSSPAMILRTLDLPAPLGPTTPIFAPGRNDSVTSSRITLSPCALRTLYMV